MAFIKLVEPGSEHTMTITRVEEDKSGNWPDWKFSDEHDTIPVPQKALERQMARLGVATAWDLKGATVKFSRSVKAGANGKYFWNADIAAPREATAAQPASKRLPPPEQQKAARSIGAPIKGMDDTFPDEEAMDTPYADVPKLPDFPGAQRRANQREDVPPPTDEDFERFSNAIDSLDPAAQPALTPREVKEKEAEVLPRDAFLTFYIDTYAQMLAGLSAVHTAAATAQVGNRSRAPEAIPALDSATVQAATATYLIQCEKHGWLSK